MGITLGHDEWIDLLWRSAHDEDDQAHKYAMDADCVTSPEAKCVLNALKLEYQKRCKAIEDAIAFIQRQTEITNKE